MDNKAIYIGQYKTGTRFVDFNIIRYTTFCLILDYYCYMNVSIGDVINNRDWLIQYVLNRSNTKDNEKNRTIINTAITNMVMIGLLVEGNGQLFITDKGKRAYINQTYHTVAASLYEAKQTRRLSSMAIIVSVISVVLAIIIKLSELACEYYCK